jgi:hypothetical protein
MARGFPVQAVRGPWTVDPAFGGIAANGTSWFQEPERGTRMKK